MPICSFYEFIGAKSLTHASSGLMTNAASLYSIEMRDGTNTDRLVVLAVRDVHFTVSTCSLPGTSDAGNVFRR